jgi:hypothetical protein
VNKCRGFSAVQQPEKERQDDANDQACHEREIEVEVPALDHDIPGQPTQAELAEPRPQQPDDNKYQANRDKPTYHRVASPFYLRLSGDLSMPFAEFELERKQLEQVAQ